MAGTKDLDFSQCRYDPTTKSFTTEICKNIPEFDRYKGSYKREVIAYIIMMFDKNSPLREKQPEYFQRKVLAAELANFPKTDSGGFKPDVKEIIEGLNQDVNALTVAYLANLGDIDYMMLISELVMFYGYQKTVLDMQYDEKTYKIIKDLSDGVRSRTRTIFGSGEHDELTRIRILLYESAEKDRQRLNPEAIVKMIERGEGMPQDWNPYGKTYEVEPLKFYQDVKEKG